MRSLISVAVVVLSLAAPAWVLGHSSEAQAAGAPGALYPLLPTQLTPQTYDYAAPETCAGCHYISAAELGPASTLDHTSRVLGVWLQNAAAVDNSCTASGVPYTCCTGAHSGTCPDTWQLTGGGWFDSRHAQSDHASTENTFCTKCHSPLQASASSSFNTTGAVINGGPVPQQRFQAVTCATCHPPDNIVKQIGAMNPGAMYGGRTAIYLWKGLNNPASWQTLAAGNNPDGTSKEDLLCLNCHEQRHNTDNPAFITMYYSVGVRCRSCHMGSPQKIGGGSTGLPSISERFHTWNVGAGLPYSCSCHSSEFTVTDMQNLIPYMKEQHGVVLTDGQGGDWWTLPPFNGEVQAAVSAHGAPTLADFKILEREISKIDAM